MWMVKMLTMAVSSFMIYSKNQMVMVNMIIMTCACLSLWMFFMSNIHWFSLLLMLIYISGIMVLFMFIVSLSPNEKTQLKKKNKTTLILSILWLTKIFFESENLKINSSFEESTLAMLVMIMIIMSMAYLPPKVIKSFYKGMKSSK